jgi:hypothetical protein
MQISKDATYFYLTSVYWWCKLHQYYWLTESLDMHINKIQPYENQIGSFGFAFCLFFMRDNK